jgi:hypothetical protein
MALTHTAEYLKKHGRGPDDQLVHMSSKELKGLQAVAMAHGGSLTINPKTGLPEAGFLDSILPMVIGAGLTVASGGALTPLMAAGITGLGYGIVEKDLGKGLMAGLGAYGGAGLGAGLMSAGATTAGGAATTEVAKDAAAAQLQKEAAKQAAFEGATMEGIGAQSADFYRAGLTPSQIAAQQSTATNFANAGRGIGALGGEAGRSAFMSGMSNAAPYSGIAGIGSAAYALNQEEPQQPAPQQGSMSTLSPNFKGSFPTPPNPAYQAQYKDYQKNPYNPYEEVYAASGGTMDSTKSKSDRAKAAQKSLEYLEKLYNPQTEYLPKSDSDIFVDSDINTKYEDALNAAIINQNKLIGKAGLAGIMNKTPEAYKLGQVNVGPSNYLTKEAASGGLMGYAYGGTVEQMSRDNALGGNQMFPMAGIGSMTNANQFQNATNTPMGTNVIQLTDYDGQRGFAGGGMTSPYNLGSYSDGGRLLKGPGDGMSDNIPASIGQKQPARLADGEFVVPADVVSHLGNGSTDAGAKKLYAMMDNIRTARTGKKKQAPAVKASKYLPA